MTMTPHIIRIPDITEDDLAPMWVGTQSNLSFRGLSPRIESQSAIDPFAPRSSVQFGTPVATDGEPVNALRPVAPPTPPPTQPNPPQVQMVAPRISPQPSSLSFKPGEEKVWNVVGMDLDGLTTSQLALRYDPHALEVSEVMFGPAINFDPKTPPIVTINRELGKVTIASSDGKPLSFNGGGAIASLRVRGGITGESFLVMENPDLKNGRGEVVASEVAGGRARVE